MTTSFLESCYPLGVTAMCLEHYPQSQRHLISATRQKAFPQATKGTLKNILEKQIFYLV